MHTDTMFFEVDESDLDYESNSDSVSYEESYSDSYTDTFDVGNYARSLDYGWR